MEKNQQLVIQYKSSVLTLAGHRSVIIVADAICISLNRCRVIRVTEIDGAKPAYNMSRTGAKRQEFNGLYKAEKEVNKIKNLSSCSNFLELEK